MKKQILSLLFLFVGLTASAQTILPYSPCEMENLEAYGGEQAENYNCAIEVPVQSLKGTDIVKLQVPINKGTKSLNNCSLWLATDVFIKSGKAAPDLVSAEATITRTDDSTPYDLLTATLPEPFRVTGEGELYAGASFNISEIASDADAKPMMFANIGDCGNLWYHASRSNRAVTNKGHEEGLVMPLQLILTGGDIAELSIAGSNFGDIYCKVGTTPDVSITLENHGLKDVSVIRYSYFLDSMKYTDFAILDTPLKGGNYGNSTIVRLNMPEIKKVGEYPVEINLIKVNDDDYEKPLTSGAIYAINSAPQRKPLLEEYTGSWCVWCIQGIIGMNMMGEHYPDDFIGLAYHNGDPMEIMAEHCFPSKPFNYPSAYMDRQIALHPYYGTVNKSLFGIEKDWKEQCEKLALAEIKLSAEWDNSERTSLTATATSRFIRNLHNANLQMAYMLVEDDMFGEGSRWAQGNALSSLEEYAADPNQAPYVKERQILPNFHFNDVVVGVSAKEGKGIEGSLPVEISEGTDITHSYTFDVASLVNTSGQKIVQNTDKLHVVAVIIDPSTGYIVNAQKCSISDSTDAISEVNADRTSNIYYNLSGQRLNSPLRGVVISNGRKILH